MGFDQSESAVASVVDDEPIGVAVEELRRGKVAVRRRLADVSHLV